MAHMKLTVAFAKAGPVQLLQAAVLTMPVLPERLLSAPKRLDPLGKG